MTDYPRQYKRALARQLRCPCRIRKELLKQFDQALANFLVDTPSPTADQLHEAFGRPADVAKLMLEQLSPSQKARCKQSQRAACVLCVVLMSIFVGFIIYVFFFQNPTVISQGGPQILNHQVGVIGNFR